MKYRYVILLVITSFVLGIYASWYSQNEKLREMRELGLLVHEYMRTSEMTRSMDKLKTANDIVDSVVSYDEREAPRRYVGEELSKVINENIKRLEKNEKNIANPSEKENIIFLKDRSKEILTKIEKNYL